jgi:hypothetical protein
MHTKFVSENLKVKSHLEDQAVDGKIILNYIQSTIVMNWIHLAKDRSTSGLL